MAVATPETVLGDFKDVSIESHGSKGRFLRDGDRFIVETEGRDGKTARFEVAWTFGVEPLQQYLVAFPDGRVQALPWAWELADQRVGRAALVPPLPRSTHPQHGPAALDRIHAELELHVLGMSLDGSPKGLRCSEGQFSHEFLRDSRRLRVLPRAGRRSSRLGARRLVIRGEPTRASTGATRIAKKSNGLPMRKPAARQRARRVRPLMKLSFARIATRDAARSTRDGVRASRCWIRICHRSWPKTCLKTTAR